VHGPGRARSIVPQTSGSGVLKQAADSFVCSDRVFWVKVDFEPHDPQINRCEK
jgi:hypothetical protein